MVAQLAQQSAGRHARDGAEFSDEVRLVVVAGGGGGDVGPADGTALACGAERAVKARKSGESFRAQAHGFVEYPTEMTLTHAEAEGDRAHAGVGQAFGGGQRELQMGRVINGGGDAVGDGTVQDCCRRSRVRRFGELLDQPTGGGAVPQIFERHDSSRNLGGRHTQHHVDVAQAVIRSLEAPSPAHRVYNVVDDEAPELGELFASVGADPPDGSDAERGRAFDIPLDGSRIRQDLGFQPQFARLAKA